MHKGRKLTLDDGKLTVDDGKLTVDDKKLTVDDGKHSSNLLDNDISSEVGSGHLILVHDF